MEVMGAEGVLQSPAIVDHHRERSTDGVAVRIVERLGPIVVAQKVALRTGIALLNGGFTGCRVGRNKESQRGQTGRSKKISHLRSPERICVNARTLGSFPWPAAGSFRAIDRGLPSQMR